jgi:putative transposase
VDVHSYVFMSNHVHLLVTSALPGALGKAIQSLGRRYVSYFNYLHQRTGTLWEGRYKSCPVTTDRYVLACMRYIDSNPIRAGIVDSPGQVRWSSFRCLALGGQDDLVTPHIVYSGLAMTDDRRRAAYQALFQERQSDDEVALIRERLQTGWMLGEGQPTPELETAAGRRLDRAKRGRPPKVAREPGDQLELT